MALPWQCWMTFFRWLVTLEDPFLCFDGVTIFILVTRRPGFTGTVLVLSLVF